MCAPSLWASGAVRTVKTTMFSCLASRPRLTSERDVETTRVQIMVWSLRTGRLLDVLSGHEGPVYGLSFSPTAALLASSSWDRTVRTWDVFEAKGAVEPFQHTNDVLTVAYRPDGKQICSSTLDGATRRRSRPFSVRSQG